VYSDAGGASCAVSGENSVRHEAGRWLFEAALRLAGDPARYAVRSTLLEEDKVLSTWALERTRR